MIVWTAIVIIVAIETLSEGYRARLKASSNKSEESLKKHDKRMARLEERLANLETIDLEKERAKKFSEL